MMYIHYCRTCSRLHILNGHKNHCPACQSPILELKLPYLSYVEMDYHERERLLERLSSSDSNIKVL